MVAGIRSFCSLGYFSVASNSCFFGGDEIFLKFINFFLFLLKVIFLCLDDLVSDDDVSVEVGDSISEGDKGCKWDKGCYNVRDISSRDSTHSQVVFGRMSGALIVTISTGTHKILSGVQGVLAHRGYDDLFDLLILPVGVVARIGQHGSMYGFEGGVQFFE